MDRPLRILLVEDHDLSGEMLVRRLGRRGFEVSWARDGAEGVELALELRPDLVIMDLSLPLLDGIAATTRIKATPETAAIPVIVLTAHTTPEAQRACAQAGADAWQTKPVDFDLLIQRIELIRAGGAQGGGR